MSSFKTKKGTELPILNLRGKDYLEVKYRIVWFREDHPDWAIETTLVHTDEKSACVRAEIKTETGRVIATSHKVENMGGFPDFLEKAETGSIGRALALIGYGTQFCADDLDEGSRIVDAPAQRPVQRAPLVRPDKPLVVPATAPEPQKPRIPQAKAILDKIQKMVPPDEPGLTQAFGGSHGFSMD